MRACLCIKPSGRINVDIDRPNKDLSRHWHWRSRWHSTRRCSMRRHLNWKLYPLVGWRQEGSEAFGSKGKSCRMLGSLSRFHPLINQYPLFPFFFSLLFLLIYFTYVARIPARIHFNYTYYFIISTPDLL